MKKFLILTCIILIHNLLFSQIFNCGDTLTDVRDGKEYQTVLIGEQCWMSENLNIGTMTIQNGSNNQIDNSVIEKYCYNNNEAECDEYGGLYQWHEMMDYQTQESSQGICPDGWHLPSDQEIMQMEIYLGMSESDAQETGFERGTTEGTQLKVGGGTGFDALFGGIWYQDFGFVYNEDYSSPNGYYYSYFWSTSPGTYNDTYMYRNVNTQFETITRWQTDWNFGYQVRCLADEFISSYHFEYNGKNYEIVKDFKSWEDAAADAVSKGGYLIEINDLEEQNAIYDTIVNGAQIADDYVTVNNGGGIAYVWLGATDKNTEGTWLWDGNDDAEGLNFWTGQGQNGTGNGQVVDELYNNWGGASSGEVNEPDNYGSGQDACAIALAGWPAGTTMLGIASEWNDIIKSTELYYVIEYDNDNSIKSIKKNKFEIFPNPANRNVTVKGNNIENVKYIRLISITGSKLYNIDNKKKCNELEIDVSYLTSGIYFLSLYNKNNILIQSEKLIIK